ncbi:hypothetical protein PM082_010765 [Marasmius tenuissimus]|nr:hypothetical protein PM082_010765 [Marasmius tenuissimus]
MTASGPFALGPALATTSGVSRRSVPKSNFTPIAAPSKGGHTTLGAGLTNTAAPTIKSEAGKGKERAIEDDEVYSEPDEGVEILDMESVGRVDYMAPDILKEEKPIPKVKKEDPDVADRGVDLANALDLSESEEEEELEDIIEDFNQQGDINENDDPSLRQDRLYFFQFPAPFPTFEIGSPGDSDPSTSNPAKKVSFAPDVKPEQQQQESEQKKQEAEHTVDGLIGRLEIYKSGAVKMRLANGILLDVWKLFPPHATFVDLPLLQVTAGTQPSFLQHAVGVDASKTRMTVLGEINKHFTVSPDVDTLLKALESSTGADGLDDLIQMDES